MSTDDTVGTAEVGQTGVLIAPAEETSVEAEEEKRTEVAEIAPQEETADLKIAVSPIRPSAADVAEHRVCHMPYRNWCPQCVAGRGLGEQRGRHAGRPHDVLLVGLEYGSTTSGGDLRRRKDLKDDSRENEAGNAKLEEARAEQRIMKCIAVRCHESKAVFAHNVPVKGRDGDNYVAGLIATV